MFYLYVQGKLKPLHLSADEAIAVVFDLKTYDIERENIYSYRDLKPFS